MADVFAGSQDYCSLETPLMDAMRHYAHGSCGKPAKGPAVPRKEPFDRRVGEPAVTRSSPTKIEPGLEGFCERVCVAGIDPRPCRSKLARRFFHSRDDWDDGRWPAHAPSRSSCRQDLSQLGCVLRWTISKAVPAGGNSGLPSLSSWKSTGVD